MSWKININGTFFITIIFVLAIVILSSLMFVDNEEYADLFVASQGVLELSSEDLEHNLPLNGEWAFFEDELLMPGDGGTSEYVTVPHTWNSDQQTGVGTYKLKIRGLQHGEIYSLYIHDLVTAYRLYIDDQLVVEKGKIGTSLETEILNWEVVVVDFYTNNDEIDVTIQLSNYHYYPGGLWREIIIGKKSNIVQSREINIAEQMIMFGCILMIGIYNVCLFILSRSERAALYFSMFSFTVAFKILFSGERLINLFVKGSNWIVLTKIQFILGYLMLALFVLFLFKLFREEFKLIMLITNMIVVTLFIITVFIFPLTQFRVFDNLYGVVAIVFLLYILYVLIKAIKNNKQGSVFSFIGLTFVLSATLLDMILPSGNNIIPLGILVFMLCQSLVIAEKYSLISTENELLHHTATRDAMTSLFKKEHFTKLTSNFLNASTNTMHHSVVFIDIDDFKVINDTYGHDAGDDFLISISERIIRSLRNSDIACRYGGDEFLVWIDNTEPEEIRMIAERLLENISEPITFLNDTVSVNVSMGLSIYPYDGKDIETLIKKSDTLMYEAKSKGKNQFIMSNESKL